MLFNNHTMTVVNSLDIVANEIRNADLFTVAVVSTVDYPNAPNIHCASILLPPTEMLMRWADGDMFILQAEYPKYLMTKECDDIIVALIANMIATNVILYIPQEDFDIFGVYLLNHIYQMYGITCNTIMGTSFSINVMKLPYIISKFYMLNIMSAQDYLASYPGQYALPEFVINKLAVELRPFTTPMPFEAYAEYFNNLNASKLRKQEAPQMMNMVEIIS